MSETTPKMREPQYQFMLERENPAARFGMLSGYVWQDDPRRMVFLLSRYKFVSKMFAGLDKVLEIGCADAFGTRIVRQEVKELVACDFDPIFIADAKTRIDPNLPIEFRIHDMLEGPVSGNFDGAYCNDVFEHILPKDERAFVGNLAKSLKATGTLIIGSPSLESQPYASQPSKEGHVNCKTAKDLKALLKDYFHQVFIFSMNDEVVHTGFYPMAHYLFAVCCHRKDPLPE